MFLRKLRKWSFYVVATGSIVDVILIVKGQLPDPSASIFAPTWFNLVSWILIIANALLLFSFIATGLMRLFSRRTKSFSRWMWCIWLTSGLFAMVCLNSSTLIHSDNLKIALGINGIFTVGLFLRWLLSPYVVRVVLYDE